MALQWRNISAYDSASFAKQSQSGRVSVRATVRVCASLPNPHSILGVSQTADVKEVKRAYRKLALQFHPDVNKSEDGHECFIALTQAYEMLLGRAEGKSVPNHASSSGWDFHDWYWNFRMHRSWDKQQHYARAAAAADVDDNCKTPGASSGRQPPPYGHMGLKQPEAREQLRSQLAGLRHRAAVRANRPAAASPTWTTSAPSASPSTWSTASGCSIDADQERMHPWAQTSSAASGGSCDDVVSETHSTAPAGRSEGLGSGASGWGLQDDASGWSWSWDETLGSEDDELAIGPGSTTTLPFSVDSSQPNGPPYSAGQHLHQQYTNTYDSAAAKVMVMHDGQLGTVVTNQAVPFPGRSSRVRAGGSSGQSATARQWTDGPQSPQQDDCAHSQAQQQQYTCRRRFAANGASREAVSHQLAGLRRKMAMKTANYSSCTVGRDTSDEVL